MPEKHRINNEALAVIARMCRYHRSWTQETLAEIAGVTLRTIQRVEKGEPSSPPYRGYVWQRTRFLGCAN